MISAESGGCGKYDTIFDHADIEGLAALSTGNDVLNEDPALKIVEFADPAKAETGTRCAYTLSST